MRQAKQDWKIGNRVKVGFLSLIVVQHNVFLDGMNCTLLINDKGIEFLFSPYKGLFRK
jgi:hypothetical protein